MESDTNKELADIESEIFGKIRDLRGKMLVNADGGLDEQEIESKTNQISQAVAG